MYIGYHETKSLPIKRGQTVTIPKGTKVKSFNPSRREYVLTRAQTVTVNHLMNGQTYTAASVIVKDGVETSFRWSVSDRDIHSMMEILDIPNETPAEKAAALAALEAKAREHLVLRYERDGHQVFDAIIHTSNPTIVWPGTGGYWCEVDINDVLPKVR